MRLPYVLLLFCLISGIILSLLSNLSSRSTQNYVDQVKVSQKTDNKTSITNSQDGLIVSQPTSSPINDPTVLQRKPVVTYRGSIPANSGSNINTNVNLRNPVILEPTTPIHSTTPKSNITKSLPVGQETKKTLEIPSGKPSSELKSKKKEITSSSEESNEEIVSDSVPISNPSTDKKSLQPPQISNNQNSPEKQVSSESVQAKGLQGYFQGRWRADPNFDGSIQYKVNVGKDGKVISLEGADERSRIFLNKTNFLKPGEVVSKNGQKDQKVWLILNYTGDVQTLTDGE